MRFLNFLGLCTLLFILGISLFIEFFYGEVPCLFCFFQRLALLGSAFGLYLNLQRGIRVQHYAISLLWSLLGLVIALRHTALNVCYTPKKPPFLFFSYRLYTWSLCTFVCSILALSALLFFYKVSEQKTSKRLTYTSLALVILFFLLTIASVFIKQKGFF
jgi:disulfide bond formation protein DsbB